MLSPILKLDSRETFRPQPVETAERYAKINGQPVDLAALPVADNLRMDFPKDLKDPDDTPVVGYHRVLKRANLYWHQFWFWYLDNPWNIEGVGRHEGDWEFVQAGCVDEAGDEPVLMTLSQHHSGQKHEFWTVEVAGGGRPVIYVAKGSHANYYTPGDRPLEGDEADGGGEVLADIEWGDFGDWATWKGLWGNSTGVGRSPQSPGCQTERWDHPAKFHALSHQ